MLTFFHVRVDFNYQPTLLMPISTADAQWSDPEIQLFFARAKKGDVFQIQCNEWLVATEVTRARWVR
jgi:hypothetical protein